MWDTSRRLCSMSSCRAFLSPSFFIFSRSSLSLCAVRGLGKDVGVFRCKKKKRKLENTAFIISNIISPRRVYAVRRYQYAFVSLLIKTKKSLPYIYKLNICIRSLYLDKTFILEYYKVWIYRLLVIFYIYNKG